MAHLIVPISLFIFPFLSLSYVVKENYSMPTYRSVENMQYIV